MTTTIIVKAHCPEDVEVVVRASSDKDFDEEVVLLDGDTWDGVVYGPRTITIKERAKS